MKLIGIEEHFLTREVRDAWAALETEEDPTIGMHQGQVGKRLEDLGEKRLRLMDETGLDVQVLSLTTPGVQDLDSAASVALAQRTNDLVAAAVALHPERFQGNFAMRRIYVRARNPAWLQHVG